VTHLTPAERLLQEMGITEPQEIDLEVIAFHLGACVRYRKLQGCEARIIGCNDAAIITINEDCSYRRKQFSLAHEIGHWIHHKGQTLVCRVEESRPQDKMSPERIANNYAADLLMPRYLFRPAARRYPKLNFKTVGDMADIFQTSRPATAIRLC
jgi:Zn-dependent peptidase ImmA (M78 family)